MSPRRPSGFVARRAARAAVSSVPGIGQVVLGARALRLLLRLVPVAVLAGLLAFGSVIAALPGTGDAPAATAAAARDIPPDMLGLYREAAAACPGLSWAVLAGIGAVETRHGRDPAQSPAGALGPMQFLPDTWQAYGLDADGDGTADVHNRRDAAFAAAAFLCAHGAADPARVDRALFGYNHAGWYVDAVRLAAAEYAAAEQAGADLLASPRVVLSHWAREDLAAGRVEARLLQLLALVAERHTIGVSVIRTGHSFHVAGADRMSLHTLGRAADISSVDGQPVTAGNAAARDLVRWLASSIGPLQLAEVGSPFSGLPAGGAFFSDQAHADHLHVSLKSPDG